MIQISETQVPINWFIATFQPFNFKYIFVSYAKKPTMKKLLLAILLFSNSSFSQETAYHLNGIPTNNYDGFLLADNGIYYVNHHVNQVNFTPEYSISYLPKNGEPGWKKRLIEPDGFYSGKCAIAACNLSDNYIISIQSLGCDFCWVLKINPNGVLIWSKLLSYSTNMSDYGSNATPITINDQDEITISITAINSLCLTKLDSNGNLLFSKRFNSTGFEDSKNPGFSVISTNDGGYLATMKAGDNPTITKLDSNLQTVWSKKWSIDSYSHPKRAIMLPNNHYCIIGTGDNGTYVAEVDPNGNLLSYKYGMFISPPFQCRVIDSDSISLFDTFGNILYLKMSNNAAMLVNNGYSGYGLPNYTNEKGNLFDFDNAMLFLNLESSQMGCFNPVALDYELSELTVYTSSVVDEAIVSVNSGTISDYTPDVTTTNDVSMTLTCSSLGIEEMEQIHFTLYPNPSVAGKKVSVAMEKAFEHSIQIVSLSGKTIVTNTLNKSVFNAPEESGIYFVQILDQMGSIIAVEKLVVE